MVFNQANTTLLATAHRTAEARLATPAPIIALVMVWVVDTGIPAQLAPNSMIDPPGRCGKPLVLRQFGDPAAGYAIYLRQGGPENRLRTLAENRQMTEAETNKTSNDNRHLVGGDADDA